jgi:hypothetical protein
MKRCFALLGVAAITLFTSGCATMLYERQTSAKVDPLSRTYDFSSADLEVLGSVEATGSSRVVLGMFTGGQEGYGLLKQAAQKKYGDEVTTVMFIFSDYNYSGVLYPFIGRMQTTYSGTAVKMKTISHTANVRVKE